MKMSRAHFQFIADVIKGMPYFAPSLRASRHSTARAFADALAATNPAFDRERFLKACGVEEVRP